MSAIIWITGLPSAGKSTLAEAVAVRLRAQGQAVLVLDGDRLRAGLSQDLDFTPQARAEQVRRAAEIAVLAAEQGLIVLAALVSPLRADRAMARAIASALPFIEVHLDATPALCRTRDRKGLWAKADAGQLHGLTGHDAPYEPPIAPELHADASLPPDKLVDALLAYWNDLRLIRSV